MKNFNSFPIYLLIIAFICSCSSSSSLSSNSPLQKRKYTKGYHFSAFDKTKHKSNHELVNTSYKISLDDKTDDDHLNSLTASVENKADFNNSSLNNLNKVIPFHSSPLVNKMINRKIKKLSKKLEKKGFYEIENYTKMLANCDLIIFSDGHEESVKILEVTNYDVKYKRCDNLNGPTFTKSIGTIFKIKYSNGSEEVYGNKASANTTNNNDSDPFGLGLDDFKEQEIALGLLALCLIGFFGIHRMYLGYWGIGILHFLTAGFCMIGTIIDLVKLLNGSLKPKNGEFNS